MPAVTALPPDARAAAVPPPARVAPGARMVELDVAGEVLAFDWGEPWELGTAAYWVEQTRRRPVHEQYALGDTLAEEIAACMLGGHGVPAAVGLAAYAAVRSAGLLRAVPHAAALEEVLRRPLSVPGRAGTVRYRFAAQRAGRLARALAQADRETPPAQPLELREWLTRLPGVGPKTASWVVRNRYPRAEVAIVDVHVQRAGQAAGFFPVGWKLPRDYERFEAAFCAVARLGRVAPGALDACIWADLQFLGPAAAVFLGAAYPARRQAL